jgi:hypothetical protein
MWALFRCFISLIPSNKKGLQKPPLIHCGYIGEEEFLFAYAPQHGLLQECPGEHEGEIVLLELDTMYAAVKAILAELIYPSSPPPRCDEGWWNAHRYAL